MQVDERGPKCDLNGKPPDRPEEFDRCGSRILSKWLDDPQGEDVRLDLSKPIPFKMGLQVPYSVRAQTTAKSRVRFSTHWLGKRNAKLSKVTLCWTMCICVSRSAQAHGGIGDRVSERKECHCYGKALWQGKKFHRRTLLGPRGCAVSTVGFELEQVRTYIREQDAADGAAGQF